MRLHVCRSCSTENGYNTKKSVRYTSQSNNKLDFLIILVQGLISTSWMCAFYILFSTQSHNIPLLWIEAPWSSAFCQIGCDGPRRSFTYSILAVGWHTLYLHNYQGSDAFLSPTKRRSQEPMSGQRAVVLSRFTGSTVLSRFCYLGSGSNFGEKFPMLHTILASFLHLSLSLNYLTCLVFFNSCSKPTANLQQPTAILHHCAFYYYLKTWDHHWGYYRACYFG